MKTFHPAPLLVLSIAAALAFAGRAAAEKSQVEIFSGEDRYHLEDARRIDVNLSFGEVRVEGSDRSDVGVVLRLTCNRQDLDKCRRRGERIRVVPRIRKGKFVLKLKHTPRGVIQGLRAHVELTVPRTVPLDVDLVGGDVFVTRMDADVAIAGGGGDVDVVARHDGTGNVNVKVVAGKAELWTGDGHMKGGGFPRSIRWQGPGESRIDIDLGAGDARVRLE
jgi:hypothetical protein